MFFWAPRQRHQNPAPLGSTMMQRRGVHQSEKRLERRHARLNRAQAAASGEDLKEARGGCWRGAGTGSVSKDPQEKDRARQVEPTTGGGRNRSVSLPRKQDRSTDRGGTKPSKEQGQTVQKQIAHYMDKASAETPRILVSSLTA